MKEKNKNFSHYSNTLHILNFCLSTITSQTCHVIFLIQISNKCVIIILVCVVFLHIYFCVFLHSHIYHLSDRYTNNNMSLKLVSDSVGSGINGSLHLRGLGLQDFRSNRVFGLTK